MGGFFSSSNEAEEEFVKQKIADNCVVVFSKSHCPYCNMAKQVLNGTGKAYDVIELDNRNDGDAIQSVLEKITGSKTVPRVFVNGECIGGGTETKKLHEQGKLVPMIEGCSS